ncbi:MAG TPA: hypothetical protein VFI87_04865 [Hyphomicrobiaceae bacterium]|nr:hypothetical protein [Hyphomicrobiaceae bacterium]
MSHMFSSHVPRLALAVAAIAASQFSFNASAHALKVESFKIESEGKKQEIHVRFDRQADNWNAVTGSQVSFRFYYSLTVKAAYALAQGSHISLGIENIDKLNGELALQSGNSHYSEDHYGYFNLHANTNDLGDLKNKAITTCRTFRSNGGRPDKEHRVQHMVRAWSWVDLSTTAPVFTEEMANAETHFPIDIVCDPDWREPPSGDLTTPDKGTFKVTSVELFLTTFHGQVTNPTPGTECKKLQVKVRIETNKIGPVTYKLWRQPGSDETRSHMVQFHEDGPFKGRFIVEDTYVDTFDKSTYAQYMAEVTSSTFGPSTQWKDISIQCTGPGGGGLTTGLPQGGGDLIPGFKVTSAQLKIIGIPGAGCPTKAFVTASYTTNKAGKFRYFIGSSADKNESGELESKKVGATYRAQETLTVDITKSGKLIAHTRAVDFPSAHAFASKAYNCEGIKPVGGLTGGSRPTHNTGTNAAPQLPKTAAPAISCGGGTVKGGSCVCPAGKAPVRAGANAWRCVAKTVDPKTAGPRTTGPGTAAPRPTRQVRQ